MYGLQTRINKEMNIKTVKSHLKKEKSERASNKIKEYDNLKKILKLFVKEKFCYVSFVYGGYKDIHEESIKYNIPLLNHDDSCYLCFKKRKKNEKFGFFTKIFTKKKDDKIIRSSVIVSGNNNINIEEIKEPLFEQKDLNITCKIILKF
jgi:hypothetical protein